MNKDYWLLTATEKIRFAPDRAAVRRELEAHIQDREDAYLSKSMTPYESEKSAVADMGDPDEVARELARLHSPWWGYLWRISQWVLALVLLWAVFVGVAFIRGQMDSGDRYVPTLPEETEVWTYSDGSTRTVHLLQSWAPKGSVKLGEYRFTAPLVYLTYAEPWTTFDSESFPEQYELTVVLRAGTWRFWEPISGSQYMILSHAAQDSSGQQYGRWEPGLFDQETHNSYYCRTYDGGLSTIYYEIYLDLPNGDVPDWVDIPIGYGGDVLRVDLREGAVS